MPTDKNMAIKLLYTLDAENVQFVAKPPSTFPVSVHTEFGIGFCRLDICINHLISSCNELEGCEYGVFSADFSEENAPLMSHGKLSLLTNTTEMISGLVTVNLLNQPIFEVKLHFKKLEDRRDDQRREEQRRELPSNTRKMMPPSSPPPVKRFHTLPTMKSDDDMQLKPEFISNSFNPLEGPLMRHTFNPKKRMIEPPSSTTTISNTIEQANKKLKVPKCANCETFYSPVWRWGPEEQVLCNSCGLWPRAHDGAMRPQKFWVKKKEQRPEHWRVRPVSEWQKGNTPFATYELSAEELAQAVVYKQNQPQQEHFVQHNHHRHHHRIDNQSSSESKSEDDLVEESTSELSSPIERPSTPINASRQATLIDKENVPPSDAPSNGQSTPVRPPLDVQGTESHHKWMARFIHGGEEHDIFEAFMRSPSKHPTRQLEIELSSALSSSPPSSTSSSNVFDVSEQDLAGIGADWIFKTPEKRKLFNT